MAAVGGYIQALTLDGRNFAVTADSDPQRTLGGDVNTSEANGDKSARLIKSVILPSIDGLTIEVDDSRGDAEFLQELANRKDYFPVAITYASGITYQGTSQIEGEFPYASQSTTAGISLKGTGNLTQQRI